MKGSMSVSVLIPVYNEEKFVEEIVKRVIETGIPQEVIIIDDASTDGTREALERLQGKWDIKVLFHEKNRGKGAAIRTGLREVSCEVVIVQDADLEYNPSDYPKLLEPILDGRADAVFGSRFLGGPHRVLYFWHYVGNKFLTLLSNALSNLNLTDMETCYKAFKTTVIKSIDLNSDRFGFEPEVTAKLAKKGYRIYETSISYSGRSYAEGKKINWRDGMAAIFHILRFNIFG